MIQLPYWIAAWLLLMGLYGMVTSRNWLHMVICLTVVQSSTYMVLLSVGYRTDAGPPIFNEVPVGTPAVDPVVQTLCLTDIVVGATTTALLLAIAVQVFRQRGTLDPAALRPMRNSGPQQQQE